MIRSALRPAGGRAFPSAGTATLEIDATLLTVSIGSSDFDRDRPILTFTAVSIGHLRANHCGWFAVL